MYIDSKNILLGLKFCVLLVACLLFGTDKAGAQWLGEAELDPNKKSALLLNDMNLQIETTQAVNDMYNFKFEQAERQFGWLKQKYPTHPLPYFLMGLSQWWKIMPDINNERFDGRFMAYMDTSIYLADRMYQENPENTEAAFFLSAAHAFKSRLYSERKSWRKAASSGKDALDYLELNKEKTDLGPEFLFGNGLYNYYAEWVPDNYALLKPVLMFFPDGDKQLGVEQLKEVANNAFYTRTEAQYFLMRILALDEKKPYEALRIAEYLHTSFPDNPYFHRYFARMLYTTGQYSKMEQVSKNILAKIDSGMVGYEANSGRYASFYLGQMYLNFKKMDEAKHYFERTVAFARQNDSYESGYLHYALISLGDIAQAQGDEKQAKRYYKDVKDYAKRKHPVHEKARGRLKEM
jgi:tetratricopeptide (TPR) repeat protein